MKMHPTKIYEMPFSKPHSYHDFKKKGKVNNTRPQQWQQNLSILDWFICWDFIYWWLTPGFSNSFLLQFFDCSGLNNCSSWNINTEPIDNFWWCIWKKIYKNLNIWPYIFIVTACQNIIYVLHNQTIEFSYCQS